MKNVSVVILALVALLFAAANERPVHLLLAGDSTMADKPAYKNSINPLSGEVTPVPFHEKGWGMLLQAHFTDRVKVENWAQNGRSTRRFIEEGWWDKLLANTMKGDYVVIQFAHNDGAVNKPDRYTSPEAYEANLVRMIKDVRAKGAHPILATAVMRRKFDAEGKLVDTHGVYPELTRKVAKDQKVPIIDLQAKTTQWLEAVGVEPSARFFHQMPAGENPLYPNGLSDNTHFNESGAKVVAGFFVDGLEALEIKPLVAALKKNSSSYVSQVWAPDLGNGRYKNPILYADYSDPDVCVVDGIYYMVASSFNCAPGLPILRSYDLVNWTLINHALPAVEPLDFFSKPQLGCGVWAPCIRYHAGFYYIFYGDPDHGVYMVKTRDPEGAWSKPVLVKACKGTIDTSPLWDDDGRVYLVHAYAGSRQGMKSVLAICELSPDASKVIGEDVLVFDGHEGNDTSEGPKFHKRNGYYYVFFPAGGVKDGWQMVMRSRSVYGPYEARRVMEQGASPLNGPHQGAWVETPQGEHWFFHFQELKPLGRVVHLQPMTWINDWPVIGLDPDGNGIGEPVTTYKKPIMPRTFPQATPAESDEFDGYTLGKQWQWYANPKPTWAYFHGDKGFIRLFSDNPDEAVPNLLFYPNLLLQKFPSPDFTATAKVRFSPNPTMKGERCGLGIIGLDYGALSLSQTAEGYVLSMVSCTKADKGSSESSQASVTLPSNEVYLRVAVKGMRDCTFSYSVDGRSYKPLGTEFQAREGQWIGAKVGLFCTRPAWKNDSGFMDVDWFRVTR